MPWWRWTVATVCVLCWCTRLDYAQESTREFGCDVSPCENNGTCVPVSASPGALPYRCTCREGFTGVNCERLLNQCEMTPNPCQQGICTSTIVNSYTCNCTGTGFRGKNCSQDIDECESSSACGSGRCFNIPGTFSCGCAAGFDGPMCQDVDECASSPCKNDAICTQGINNYTCSCAPGFEGNDCQTNIDDCANATCSGAFTRCVDGVLSHQCVCLDGYRNQTGQCVEIDECADNPCRNNATCQDRVNAFRCDCVAGFTGVTCEVNINECQNVTCGNNGTCVDGVNTFTCECVPGFTGLTCETNINDCVNHQCRNGASCEDLVSGYRCACVQGWTGDRCGTNIDDCTANPCRNNATCNDFVDYYNCTCAPGFTDFHCGTNIDDCSPDPCQNSASCADGTNDYACRCTEAWMGKNCSALYDACSFQPCRNNATCNSTIGQRQYQCACMPGFNGTDCENNVDDCVGHTCRSFEHCLDGINNYTCACPIGYTGARCGQEINECDPEPCQNGGTCNDFIGFHNCSCPQRYINRNNYPTGYRGINCDEDIDECAYDPPICQNGGICSNLQGSYQCRCLGQTPTGELVTGLNCQLITSYCLVGGGNPCRNDATCLNVFGTYACVCLPGYTDKNCSTNIDECQSSPCGYNGTCIDLVNGYNCTCIPGITGSNCETNIDDCEGNPCGPGACHDKINDYECNCTDTGFKGRNCQKNIDDCLPGICQHNGTCRDGIKNYTCECQAAYTGRNCQADIPECTPSPCQYNGTCLEYSDQSLYGQARPQFAHFSYATAAGYLCECIAGITGVNCSINIDDCVEGVCQNNATCQDGIASFSCLCAPGYEGSRCGTEIDECTRYSPCQNGATCKDRVADYSCTCQEFSRSRQNYGGKNCSVYLSGCDGGDGCKNGQCVPRLASELPVRHDYECQCSQGYRGRYCDVPTAVSFSSNGSLIRYTPPPASLQAGQDVLSFRFITTLTHTVLALYAFSPDKLVSVEIEEGRLSVVFRDDDSQFHQTVDSQEDVNNARWHQAFLNLRNNVSLTLAPALPLLPPTVYFGNMAASLLSKTRTKRMYVGCLEDIVLDRTPLYPGQREGEYISVQQRCPRTKQCEAYTCHRHGACEDLWDSFRCDCSRPYWGTLCEKEYTAATFSKDGLPSLATFRLNALSSTFATGLNLSLFLRTRQKQSIIMYLTDGNTSSSSSSSSPATFMTLEMRNGCLASRLSLCGSVHDFNESANTLDFGWLNFVQVTFNDNKLLLKVNGSVCINATVPQSSCPLRANVVYFGQVPEIHGSRRRRQASSSVLPVNQLQPYNGILQDVRLQTVTLDFQPRGAQGNTSLLMAGDSSNVTLGAESTVSVCNTSQPCENGGTCSDVFFNDFRCACPDGYLGKNCSRPDFCKANSCPSGARCQSLQQGFECISSATFNGVSSLVTYAPSLSSGLPSQRVTFYMRTRSFHGAIMELRARSDNHFIKIRVRGGSLEVNYLLKPSGFSSSLRLLKPVNDGQRYYVEMEINAGNAMSLRFSRQGTIVEEKGPELLEDTVTDLSSLVTGGTIQIGDVADGKERAFRGCLEEVRIGGILLPFVLNSTMNQNTAVRKFLVTLSRVDPGCPGSGSCVGSRCVHGVCNTTWGDYRCECSRGFAGRFCEREVDECQAEGCLNGGLCLDGVGPFTCVCPAGYTGARCESLFNACANNSCSNSSTCRVVPNVTQGYVCTCTDNTYGGDLCNVSIENKSCADNLCQNSAACTDDQNSSTFSCGCAPGYTGSLCESQINYCVNLPCNNGTCTSDAASQNFTCQCSTGFTGDVCETNIDNCVDNVCRNEATCVDGIDQHTCQCTSGWTGPNCTENIDECQRDVCQHGACQDLSPGYHCNCSNTGYTGVNCSVELNECEHKFCVAETSSNCTNTEGGYLCDCLLGYRGANCSDVSCQDGQCRNGSTCSTAAASWGTDWVCQCRTYFGGRQCNLAGPCVSEPCNATNTDRCQQSDQVFNTSQPSAGNYTCLCRQGWEGATCSEDVNECSTDICQNNATCRNLAGSFECSCAPGYTGTYCETDIDECAVKPCQNGGICTQGVGTFTCNCTGTGYKGANCSQDVNECERFLPCQNNNTCVNTVGSFTCECGGQYLGDRCEHQNPCNSTLCNNGGTCNHTWEQTSGTYLPQCSCVDGYQGSRCEQSTQSDDDDLDLVLIIGPLVAAVLLIILIGVIVFVMVARKKRATHGAYSPSRQETAGARVELGNVLKKPPEERLI
ncbi:hypothetical protein ACOMHN_012594 [Nucella lapillus]